MLAYKAVCMNVSILHNSLIAILCLTWMLSTGLQASNTTDNSSEDERYVVLPCHEEWDPSPCVCHGFRDEKIPRDLSCSNISTLENFQTIFSQMKQPIQLNSFVLSNSSLKMLPAGVFRKVTFKIIGFFNTSVEKLEPGVFQGMEETLTELVFFQNKIKIIDFLNGLRALETIHFQNELCEEIADYGLANLRGMKLLFIYECSLRTIGNYAFANTTGRIKIMDNMVPVARIGDYVFGENPFITLTNVTDASFSKKTFVDSSITTLTVEGLTTLKEDIFAPLLHQSNGARYTFRGTAMKCDESMDWIVAKYGLKQFRFKCENGKTLQDNVKARQTSS